MDEGEKKEVKTISEEVGIFIGLLILVAAAPAILAYLKEFFGSVLNPLDPYWPSIVRAIKSAEGILVGICIPLSLLFLIGIIYCVEQLKRIRKKEAEIYDLKVEQAYETVDSGDPALAHRWENVMKHLDSPNENDWRQAVMDADIILDDILTKMGYRGETVGEKLKRVVSGDFNTVDDAWEAHKTRNQIAHEGSGFSLNHHEAKKVIHLYRRVFEEFYYI